MTLWGRSEQCRHLDGMLADVRAGRSLALVVRGGPGIGKTALLKYVADTAPDFQVARSEGVESGMELPFAALHQLCGRRPSHLDRLPGPQRDALGVAFGLRSGAAPGIVSGSAWLFWVDDAQWLDQASVQAFDDHEIPPACGVCAQREPQ
jgi:hypothetical protein